MAFESEGIRHISITKKLSAEYIHREQKHAYENESDSDDSFYGVSKAQKKRAESKLSYSKNSFKSDDSDDDFYGTQEGSKSAKNDSNVESDATFSKKRDDENSDERDDEMEETTKSHHSDRRSDSDNENHHNSSNNSSDQFDDERRAGKTQEGEKYKERKTNSRRDGRSVNNPPEEQQSQHDNTQEAMSVNSLLEAVIGIKEDEQNNNSLDDFQYSERAVKSSKRRPKTAVAQFTGTVADDDRSSVISMQSRSSRQSRPISNRSHAGVGPSPKLSMSFSNTKVKDIDAENQRLLKEIVRLKSGDSMSTTSSKLRSSKVRPQSASYVNRNRRQQEIDRENLRLLKKIQIVKPTAGLARDKLLKEQARNERHVQRISRSGSRPTSAPFRRNIQNEWDFDTRSNASNSTVNSRASSAKSRVSSATSKSGTSSRPRVIVEKYWEPGW